MNKMNGSFDDYNVSLPLPETLINLESDDEVYGFAKKDVFNSKITNVFFKQDFELITEDLNKGIAFKASKKEGRIHFETKANNLKFFEGQILVFPHKNEDGEIEEYRIDPDRVSFGEMSEEEYQRVFAAVSRAFDEIAKHREGFKEKEKTWYSDNKHRKIEAQSDERQLSNLIPKNTFKFNKESPKKLAAIDNEVQEIGIQESRRKERKRKEREKEHDIDTMRIDSEEIKKEALRKEIKNKQKDG